MKQLVYVMILSGIVAMSSCTEKFVKSEKGWQYKIVKDGNGAKPEYGNFIMYEMKNYLATGKKDTIFSDTRDGMIKIDALDSVSKPAYLYKILSQLRKGDSVVLKCIVDSLIPPGQPFPPFAKKGQFYYETYKIVDILKDVKEATAAYKTQQKRGLTNFNKKVKADFEKEYSANAAQLKIDDKIITDYLAKNNITNATKTKWGTYIVVKEPGTGDVLNDSSVAKVLYAGRFLTGGQFDANIDSATGKLKVGSQPYPVYMSQFGGGVIMGWYDALQQLRNGAKATIYVPSTLAYGKKGNQGIKPDDVLMFDIQIAEVTTFAEETAKQEEAQKKQEAEQLRMQDSMQRAQAKQPTPQPSTPKK